MVMHYLVQRNEEYIAKVEDFEEKLNEIIDFLKVLEYNIKELQQTVRTLRTNDAEDLKLKESFNAK